MNRSSPTGGASGSLPCRVGALLVLLLAPHATLLAQRPATTADTVWMESFWVDRDFVVYGSDTAYVFPGFFYELEQAIRTVDEPDRVTVLGFGVARPLPAYRDRDAPSRLGVYESDLFEGSRHRLGGPPLVRLPQGVQFTVGFTWSDSIIPSDSSGRYDRTWTHRSFEVVRMVDTLGTRAVVVEADVRTREHRELDPTFFVTESLLSTQVAGTGRSRYVFDTVTGRVLAREGELSAAGFAAVTRGDSVQSIPAGQRTLFFRRPIDPGRVALLWRARHSGSSETTGSDGAPEVYHRTDLRGDTAESLHLSATSGVTVARTTFREGRVVRHVVERTRPNGSRAASVAVQGEDAASDIRLRPPSGVVGWGVAEEGMEEHLVPVLRSLAPSEERQRFAIYRPLEGRWDRVLIRRATRANRETFYVLMGMDGQPRQVICYASATGALLFTLTRVGERWRHRIVPRDQDGLRAVVAWNWFIPTLLPEVGTFSGRI